MSDAEPPIPPPTPGTTSLLRRDEAPSLRPYREEPAIAQDDRRAGRLTYTEQARGARVDVVARDLAAEDSPERGPIDHPIGRELIAEAEANLAREIGAHAADRATVESQSGIAVEQRQIATRRQLEAQRSLRGARAGLPERPVGGTSLTRWWIPLLVAPVLVYLEIRMGAPGLSSALSISQAKAELAAAAIAIGLTIAAEALGLVLGSVVRHSRAIARAVLVSFAVALVGTGGWAVVKLASGRTDNLVYRGCKVEKEEALTRQLEAEENGGLGGLTRKGEKERGATTSRSGPATPSVSPICRSAKPDLGFTVPLTMLAMLASALLATRVALATEWREARDRLSEAEERYDSSTQTLDRTQKRRPAAELPLGQSELELGAVFEREVATTARLFAQLEAEYRRWCAHFKRVPHELLLPEVPDPAMLMARMLGVRELPPAAEGAAEQAPASADASAGPGPLPPSPPPDEPLRPDPPYHRPPPSEERTPDAENARYTERQDEPAGDHTTDARDFTGEPPGYVYEPVAAPTSNGDDPNLN